MAKFRMHYPVPHDLRLPDGRTLEYAEYGDPGGIPLLYFHGFLGSIYEVRYAK